MKDNKTDLKKKPVCQMRWNLKCAQTSDNSKLSLSLF
jgi:hypothetical protein